MIFEALKQFSYLVNQGESLKITFMYNKNI